MEHSPLPATPGAHRFCLLLCVGLTALILWLALMPGEATPAGLGWDKLNHAVAIAAVTVVAFLALYPRRRAALEAFLYGALLGALIEILQGTLTTTRSAEWGDLLADLAGGGCVWLVLRFVLRPQETV